MVLLRDEAQMEARFGPFGYIVSFSARLVLRNSFGRTGWYSYVTRLKWKLVSVHLDIALILIQDRCMVFAERTVGSKIILDAPDETPM
jgi:hypothetical protein